MWFHVDNLSSAHVYLRQNKGEKLDDISDATLQECAQLVKANSIEGCKKKSVTVIYTRWKNLKKTASMEVGAISFRDRSKVRSMEVTKENPVVNALNRTKTEDFPDLEGAQQQRAAEFRADQKRMKKQQEAEERQAKQQAAAEAEIRNYTSLMQTENMTSNDETAASADATAAEAYEDDFF